MYFPKPALNENDLAIIERGATAAHSIEAGQYVSWHGKTGKAKAAILQGATLSSSLFDYDDEGALNALNASLSIQTIFEGNVTSGSVTVPDIRQYKLLHFHTRTSGGNYCNTYPTSLLTSLIGLSNHSINLYMPDGTGRRLVLDIENYSTFTVGYNPESVAIIHVYAQ